MAGGKETPRQKMIGMMYLVLTALLALNVAKEIVTAFVKINDRIESSSGHLIQSTLQSYERFDNKRAALIATGASTKEIDFWQHKSSQLAERTRQIIHYLLSEANELIQEAEGKDWVSTRDDQGYITGLNSLMGITKMDNYDIPTNFFVGGNPKQPKARGLALADSIHKYRNYVVEALANYEENGQNYSLKLSENQSFQQQLKHCNPKDTAKLIQLYNQLTIPELHATNDGGKIIQLPWPSAMFDHAPIVATVAILNSLKLDIVNVESLAAEMMLSKVDSPIFNFNRIEPLAFAPKGYLNTGDSMQLRVMIAAYDTNEVVDIRYGINGDTTPERWKSVNGPIPIKAQAPGDYTVKGQIAVRERGQINWKDWSFNYKVGKPSATVSLPEMNVLYRRYDNKVVGAVTGYSNYNLVPVDNIQLRKQGDIFLGQPGAQRTAKIGIQGISDDGSRATLGIFEFRVKNLPSPKLNIAGIFEGKEITKGQLSSATKLFAKFEPDDPIDLEFSVVEYTINIQGAPRDLRIIGNAITDEAKRFLRQAPANSVITISAIVKEPGSGGVTRKKIGAFVAR
jgi:gliding motility-associated protein GldM